MAGTTNFPSDASYRPVSGAQDIITEKARPLLSDNVTGRLLVDDLVNPDKEDSNNATTTPLDSDEVFTGSGTDTFGYSTYSILVHSDTQGDLLVEYAPDNSDWHPGESYSVSANTTKFFTPPLQDRYIRITYTNGGDAQSVFHLHPVLRGGTIKPSSHNLNDNLRDDDDAELSVSVLKLRTAQDNYVSGAATNSGNFKVSLEEFNGDVSVKGLPVRAFSPTSAFGDAVTNELTPILQYAFEYNTVDNTEFWKIVETSGGTVSTSNAMAILSSSSTANSVANMQSVRPARYRSGFGSKLRFTAKFSTPAANCMQIIGIFDESGSTNVYKNGYGIGYDGTTFKLINFTNDADNSVLLSNADDPLDGSGASGVEIDQTKLNIFEIDFAYLGAGDIVFRIYSTIENRFVEIHRIHNANTKENPHSYNPNFRVCAYVDNGATTSNVSVSTASIMYAIQGKTRFRELQQTSFDFSTSIDSVTTQTQMFSIRNKSTYTSVANFIDIILSNVSASYQATAAARGVLKIVKNPTLGGTASWTDINTTDSIVEYDTAQTTVSNQGKVLGVLYFAGQFDKDNFESLMDDSFFISPGDEVAILVESTQSATFNAFLSWRELF